MRQEQEQEGSYIVVRNWVNLFEAKRKRKQLYNLKKNKSDMDRTTSPVQEEVLLAQTHRYDIIILTD